MLSNSDEHKNQSNDCDKFSLEEMSSAMIAMRNNLKDLHKSLGMLPGVDEKGRSECEFAEDLYAQKEEDAQKVSFQLKALQNYLEPLEKEISRCRKNLEQIRSDGRQLYTESAKEEYLHAEAAAASLYNQVVSRKKELIQLISRAKDALKKAKVKRWPLGEPKKTFHLPAMAVGPRGQSGFATPLLTPLPVPGIMAPPGREQIASLLSLGPLGAPLLK